jgi:hypothetical protein
MYQLKHGLFDYLIQQLRNPSLRMALAYVLLKIISIRVLLGTLRESIVCLLLSLVPVLLTFAGIFACHRGKP